MIRETLTAFIVIAPSGDTFFAATYREAVAILEAQQ